MCGAAKIISVVWPPFPGCLKHEEEARRAVTSPLAVPPRIFWTVAGVIAALGLCVRALWCV